MFETETEVYEWVKRYRTHNPGANEIDLVSAAYRQGIRVEQELDETYTRGYDAGHGEGYAAGYADGQEGRKE